DEFVRKTGWGQFADEEDTYYDGIAVAKALGVALTPERVRFRGQRRDETLSGKWGSFPRKESHPDREQAATAEARAAAARVYRREPCHRIRSGSSGARPSSAAPGRLPPSRSCAFYTFRSGQN